MCVTNIVCDANPEHKTSLKCQDQSECEAKFQPCTEKQECETKSQPSAEVPEHEVDSAPHKNIRMQG